MSGQATASQTVYVVSGASRGLGYGVLEKLAARDTAIIYAGARDPSKADKLQQLAKKHNNVHVVQLRADSEEDHKTLAALVQKEAGRADVVWANAGISPVDVWAPVQKVSVTALREHIEVNTIHALYMFQSFYTLLGRSSSPRFFVTTSVSGSTGMLEMMKDVPQLCYGLSKAAVNNLTRRIHFENPNITAVPFHPGSIHTHSLHALSTSVEENTRESTVV